eukprot:CAMPEP_0171199796 /NCGR_PEP_ID=MMETSP0790-20130122/23650_1 /TAXON_ID=2925 /ORGANISM="Alexandrium catenella, Strain OF101" /LENGTH=96 /DNA_ID=CAMNT_0011665157 /DNA_START=409 /DNA_END=696 /DNA_ORIENTATION=+
MRACLASFGDREGCRQTVRAGAGGPLVLLALRAPVRTARVEHASAGGPLLRAVAVARGQLEPRARSGRRAAPSTDAAAACEGLPRKGHAQPHARRH